MTALLEFLIAVIIICVVAGVVLWAIGRFFPEIYTPARLIVGAVAVVAILYRLLALVQGGMPGFP